MITEQISTNHTAMVMPYLPPYILLLAPLAFADATVTLTKTVSLPTSRPASAFNVPPNFVSVGFESAFLPGYNNDFSINLMESLAKRMSEKPVIRIGGTSGYVNLAAVKIFRDR